MGATLSVLDNLREGRGGNEVNGESEEGMRREEEGMRREGGE